MNIKPQLIHTVQGTPEEVTAQLSQLTEEVHVDIALIAFYLHHFDLQQILSALKSMRKIAQSSVVIDYTLHGVDTSLVRKLVTSRTEQAQIERSGGFERWLSTHDGFTRSQLEALFRTAGFPNVSSLPLRAGRAIVLGSDSMRLSVANMLGQQQNATSVHSVGMS
ncbi:MAG: hypothetical protein Q7R81_06170 [Candidatus Peregrinibacteria bacterium]|nr:hypothetical protein [Candidatus Peregrinibacteria bacterium]